MISAAEARERAGQAELLKKIGKNIKRCTKKGMYSMCMQIPASTSDYVRGVIAGKLYDMGYLCTVPPQNKECTWSFDVIEVSWENENV